LLPIRFKSEFKKVHVTIFQKLPCHALFERALVATLFNCQASKWMPSVLDHIDWKNHNIQLVVSLHESLGFTNVSDFFKKIRFLFESTQFGFLTLPILTLCCFLEFPSLNLFWHDISANQSMSCCSS
jgi:hypothetical protein